MDYIKTYIFGDYMQKRLLQVEREASIDRGLMLLPCEEVVNAYIFRLRHNNRVRIIETVRSNDKDVFTRHLSQVDDDLAGMENVLQAKNPCEYLKLITDS